MNDKYDKYNKVSRNLTVDIKSMKMKATTCFIYLPVHILNKPERVQPIKSRSEKFKNGYFLDITNMRYILALVSVCSM